MNVTNIGPRESRKRLLFGLVMLALGIIAAAALSLVPAAVVYWRLLLFIPFWLAALNVLQAKRKLESCWQSAARGSWIRRKRK